MILWKYERVYDKSYCTECGGPLESQCWEFGTKVWAWVGYKRHTIPPKKPMRRPFLDHDYPKPVPTYRFEDLGKRL